MTCFYTNHARFSWLPESNLALKQKEDANLILTSKQRHCHARHENEKKGRVHGWTQPDPFLQRVLKIGSFLCATNERLQSK